MKFLLVFTAQTPVLQAPIVKSKTVSHSFVYVLIKYSISATGFWVGWRYVDAPFFSYIMVLGNLSSVYSFLIAGNFGWDELSFVLFHPFADGLPFVFGIANNLVFL